MKTLFITIMTLIYFDSFCQKEQIIIDTIIGKNGKILGIERYLDTKKFPNKKDINNRHGNFLSFYETGELESSSYYKNGSQDSIITYFYKNGNKKEEGYLRPWRVGTWTTWFENGNKESQGAWDNSTQIGKWKFWDSTGCLTREIFFKDSMYTSTFYFYHPNRKIKSTEKYKGPYLKTSQLVQYKNNIKENEREIFTTRDFSKDFKHYPTGTWQTFDENGILVEEEIYSK